MNIIDFWLMLNVAEQTIEETDMLSFVDLSRPPSRDIEDDGPISVRDALVFLGHAHFVSPHSLPTTATRAIRRKFFTPELPRKNQMLQVSICFVQSPGDFYINVVG